MPLPPDLDQGFFPGAGGVVAGGVVAGGVVAGGVVAGGVTGLVAVPGVSTVVVRVRSPVKNQSSAKTTSTAITIPVTPMPREFLRSMTNLLCSIA